MTNRRKVGSVKRLKRFPAFGLGFASTTHSLPKKQASGWILGHSDHFLSFEVEGLNVESDAAKVSQATVYQKHNSLQTRKGKYRG
jgi:hypothetical protein